MIQVLLILLFAAMHLAPDIDPWLPVHPSLSIALMLWLVPLMTAVMAHGLLARRAGAAMDRHGETRAFVTAELFASRIRVAGLFWYLTVMLGAGWVMHARTLGAGLVVADVLLVVGPPVAFLGALWWNMYPLEARLREALLYRQIDSGAPVYEIPTRWQFVWGQIKHHVLLILMPVLLISTWDGLLDLIVEHRASQWPWFSAIEPFLRWCGIAGALIAAPSLLKWLWSTVLLQSGPLVANFTSMCECYNVRIRGPYIWRTHGAMVNGAVLGAFWPLRYLLLTDALVEQLDSIQVEGVLAHEVAHVKMRHMAWLLVSVIASVLLTGWLCSFAALAWGLDSQSELVGVLASLASLAAAVLVFGTVSRRFEWQADAFAVRHLSHVRASDTITPMASHAMESALGRVAHLNGVAVHAFSWRHGSILTRQNRLRELIGTQGAKLPIDRTVRRIKLLSVLVCLLGGAPLVWEWWSGVPLTI
ncbi:MAG: M48 family metalloprotease [Planctomycetota bacterium]|nr:M48 family metalloprotease [Planctomycetota bacterium]